jgi:integrase
MHVSEIETKHVADVLLQEADIRRGKAVTGKGQLWYTKQETAARLRDRMFRVLAWAEARSYRSPPNPARWDGGLGDLLGGVPKRRKKHHDAIDYRRIGSFVAKLREVEGIGALALEFNLLTATRANETLQAKWDEIDLGSDDGPTWTIPGERIKTRRPLRVPLSTRAVEILETVRPLKDESGLVFPSPVKDGEPLTSAALLALVKEVSGDATKTTHGTVRSGFTDWAEETTNFPTGVVRAALAHVVGDKTQQAYQRGDLFTKRRKLMQAWADYCNKKESGKVLPLKRNKAA